ncbi:Structural maintenance of chromosomes protein 4 [Microbotryomycetes sp. JL201]|nr:Structural maintenance of chromosomes protein 4 [Microbotryomycetes sp. JL201]
MPPRRKAAATATSKSRAGAVDGEPEPAVSASAKPRRAAASRSTRKRANAVADDSDELDDQSAPTNEVTDDNDSEREDATAAARPRRRAATTSRSTRPPKRSTPRDSLVQNAEDQSEHAETAPPQESKRHGPATATKRALTARASVNNQPQLDDNDQDALEQASKTASRNQTAQTQENQRPKSTARSRRSDSDEQKPQANADSPDGEEHQADDASAQSEQTEHDEVEADLSEDEVVGPRRRAKASGKQSSQRRVLEDEDDQEDDEASGNSTPGPGKEAGEVHQHTEASASAATSTPTKVRHSRSGDRDDELVQDACITPRPKSDAEVLAKLTAPTPAPAHIAPTAYDLAAAARMAALNHAALEKEREKEREGKPRLVIHQLVLEDFKSYRGRNVIGPFHKSFSSIVGPNGSGKSNTIDALLFVFGYRATKMRQGKLSELIHNSGAASTGDTPPSADTELVDGAEFEGSDEDEEDYVARPTNKKSGKNKGKKQMSTAPYAGGLDSCTVEVWFREIVDLPGGRDEFSVVPDSSLVVARTAYRNNSSRYTINGKTSNYSEVTTLLKARGIDLDHKRFLILQGEVESIAQMKPKGANEHDEGLLEYLEDIIGTSKYKVEIESAMVEVERLNEERGTQMNRVKLVEREKSALEGRRREADGYLRDQNELTHNQSALFQINIHQASQNSQQHQQDFDEAEAQLKAEIEAQADTVKETEVLQCDYDELEVEKATNEIVKQLSVLERADVQLQEKKKSTVAKIKKLRKTIADDTHAKSEAETWVQNHTEAIERVTKDLESMAVSLDKEEAQLEKVRDGLKGKTEVYSVQIEQLQQDLQPWASEIADKQSQVDLTSNERDLLLEKSQSVKLAMSEATDSLERLREESQTKSAARKELLAEKQELASEITALEQQLRALRAKDVKLRSQTNVARLRAEEAKASQSASRSQGNVLASLTKLKDQGRLPGFLGRLGDLGRIDDKYDVAISTAAPGLDNLVTETISVGQACIEHLRKNDLGRANIMCLDRITARDMSPIQTPENAPRLFDLVSPKDSALAPAFFQILTHTLVATDLEQGKRLAFGSGKRWRVVTLDGQLIDTSGTMSGGGGRPARGRMGSKIASDDVSPEVMAKCEQEHKVATEALQALVADCQRVERELKSVQSRLPVVEMEISKIEMELEANQDRIQDTERLLAELKVQSKPDAGEVRKIAQLDRSIAALQNELESLQKETTSIENKIKKLQDKILEVGGIKLRSQQTLVTDLKAQIDAANDRLTKAEVGKVKSEKDVAKLTKALTTNEQAVEAAEADLNELTRQIEGGSQESETVRKHVEQAQAVLDEKKEELNEMKAVLDEKTSAMTEFRKRQSELTRQRDEAKRLLAEDKRAVDHWVGKLGSLQLNELVDDDGDEENSEDKAPRLDAELREWTIEELADFDTKVLKAKISALEERIAQTNLDLSVLNEYARREKEFMQRAADLEAVTKERDAAKQKADDLRNLRLKEFMEGFGIISMKLKEMYQMITLGGNAELELVDSLDPFSEGIIFSVMPPKKSWKNISNLSGGEKTLSSLALVFALHVFKPTPLYFMDEIDAALDFRNVSIVANYIKDRTKNAQFIIISLRNNMFELSSRLIGIYKVANQTQSVAIGKQQGADGR